MKQPQYIHLVGVAVEQDYGKRWENIAIWLWAGIIAGGAVLLWVGGAI